MRRFVEIINTASEKLAYELISPDAVFQVPGRADPLRGPRWLPCSDWDDAKRLSRFSMDARRDDSRRRHGRCPPHYARYASWHLLRRTPPTGKTIAVQAMSFYRLSSGQFIEERGQPDLLWVAPANCRCAYSGWQRLRIASDNGEYQAASSLVPAGVAQPTRAMKPTCED